MVSAGVLYHTVEFKHPFQIYLNLDAKGIEFISTLDPEECLWETQISGLKGPYECKTCHFIMAWDKDDRIWTW